MFSKRGTLTILIAVLLVGCSVVYAENKYGIIQAANDLGNLNTFITAIEKVDLVNRLNDQGTLNFVNDTYVVFAPNDQAFKSLPSGTLDALLANEGDLSTVLKYHVIENPDNWDINRAATYKSFQGEDLVIDNRNGVMTVNGARVLGSKRYSDGYLYVIDRVLMPTAMNLTEEQRKAAAAQGQILETLNRAGLGKFSAAVAAADLVDQLNGRGTLGITHAGPYTIFAPNDAAFAGIPGATMDSLLANKDDLQTLLKYHIVDSDDLNNTNRAGLTSYQVKTLQGGNLNINTANGVTVNGARVLNTLRYDNGVVYAIDRVLLPKDTDFLNKYNLRQLATAPAAATGATPGFGINTTNESLPPQPGR